MSSIDDDATELEMKQREISLKAQLGRSQPEKPWDWDGVTCYDCGGEIVPGRLALGFFNCIECQQLKERRQV